MSVLDIDGNVVTTSTASIGVAVVEAGATLAGTTPVAAVSGINTFSGLKLTGTVGTYTLRYTSTGLTSVDDSITLTYGAADHLAITTGAAGIVNRVAFTTQPTVVVQDASNNTVFNSTVTIAASASTGQIAQCTVSTGGVGSSDLVRAVVVTGRISAGSSGPANVQANVRTSGTDYYSSNIAAPAYLDEVRHEFSTNPGTGSNWTAAQLTAAGFNVGFRSQT